MKVKIFTGPLNYNISLYKKEDNDYIIGVDQACLFLIENGITPDLGLGDFDSVSKAEYEIISNYIKNLDSHSSIKDFTDTDLAVTEALKLKPDSITIYGGMGNRLDHTLANIRLLSRGHITMIDNMTKMYVLNDGVHYMYNNYKYISFFAIEDVSDLSLSGFKYELNKIKLGVHDPLCVSNEGEGTVSFTKGKLLVVHQNE